MEETFDFTTKCEVTYEYSVPLNDLKEILADNDLNYEDMSKDEIADYISINAYEFSDYTVRDAEYSDVEVMVF